MGNESPILGVECGGGARGLLLQGGRPRTEEPKVSPPQLRSPSPEAPAWRLEDRAVGTSGEQLPGLDQSRSRGTGQARPEVYKAKSPREWGQGEQAGLEQASTNMVLQPPTPYSCCCRSQTTRAQGPSPAVGDETSPSTALGLGGLPCGRNRLLTES